MSKRSMSTAVLTKIALLTACMCVSAYITLRVPPIVLTLQTLIMNIAAILLTPFESLMMMSTYLIIGFIGIPVFSGGTGGIARLVGPTGGFIIMFLIATPAMSFTKRFFKSAADKFIKDTKRSAMIAYAVNAVVVGMSIEYILGALHMMLLTGRSLGEVLMLTVYPYIPLDLIKCIVGAIIAVPIAGTQKK